MNNQHITIDESGVEFSQLQKGELFYFDFMRDPTSENYTGFYVKTSKRKAFLFAAFPDAKCAKYKFEKTALVTPCSVQHELKQQTNVVELELVPRKDKCQH